MHIPSSDKTRILCNYEKQLDKFQLAHTCIADLQMYVKTVISLVFLFWCAWMHTFIARNRFYGCLWWHILQMYVEKEIF